MWGILSAACGMQPIIAHSHQLLPTVTNSYQKLPKVAKTQSGYTHTDTRTHERTGGLLELLSQLIAGWLKRQSEPTRPGLTKTFCQTFKGKI